MNPDPALLALYVDFNGLTGSDDGREAYWINFGVANPPALEAKLKAGSRIIIHDSELWCEAVLERSGWAERWIGVLTQEATFKDLEPGAFERLETATKRAADES